MHRKAVVFIAASIDGFIASHDGDLSFLSAVAKEGEDYGYADFISTVDTVVLGRNTYDKVISMGYPFPHADKEVFIITRTATEPVGSTQFYTGDAVELLHRLKQEEGRCIFIDGGAYVINRLLEAGLVDELYLSLIPVLLGNGIRLFAQNNPAQKMQLQQARSFDTGLVQLRYSKLHS